MEPAAAAGGAGIFWGVPGTGPKWRSGVANPELAEGYWS